MNRPSLDQTQSIISNTIKALLSANVLQWQQRPNQFRITEPALQTCSMCINAQLWYLEKSMQLKILTIVCVFFYYYY